MACKAGLSGVCSAPAAVSPGVLGRSKRVPELSCCPSRAAALAVPKMSYALFATFLVADFFGGMKLFLLLERSACGSSMSPEYNTIQYYIYTLIYKYIYCSCYLQCTSLDIACTAAWR